MLGGGLRFYRLGDAEISRGEAAAWAAADAPSLHSVYVASNQLDPGKAGIYDLVLHGWITAFGDQVGAMRSLSAILGTLMIPLLFVVVHEVLGTLDDPNDDEIEMMAGAYAALLYAVNLRMITTDRTARMYTLMLLATLAQMFFFVRASRRPGARNILATTLFTVLATASNVLAVLAFAAEVPWLALVWLRSSKPSAGQLSLWRPLSGLALAALFYAPIAIVDTHVAVTALHRGIWSTIEPQPIWWPLRAIQVMSGNAAFWPMLILVVFGIWQRGLQDKPGLWFIACWTLGALALVELASYVVTPMMVERYVFPSLIGFLVLVSLGLASVRPTIIGHGLAALIVGQSLAHVHHHWRAPEDAQWHEAVRYAVGATPAANRIATIPPDEPLQVMRYYLAPADRDRLVNANATLDKNRVWQLHCDSTSPVLIASTELPRETLAEAAACYPRLLARFRLVEVRAK